MKPLIIIAAIYCIGIALCYFIVTKWNHTVFFFLPEWEWDDDKYNTFISVIWPVFIITYITCFIFMGLYLLLRTIILKPVKKLIDNMDKNKTD